MVTRSRSREAHLHHKKSPQASHGGFTAGWLPLPGPSAGPARPLCAPRSIHGPGACSSGAAQLQSTRLLHPAITKVGKLKLLSATQEQPTREPTDVRDIKQLAFLMLRTHSFYWPIVPPDGLDHTAARAWPSLPERVAGYQRGKQRTGALCPGPLRRLARSMIMTWSLSAAAWAAMARHCMRLRACAPTAVPAHTAAL